MGDWYSRPLILSISAAIKQEHGIDIPDHLCEIIVMYFISIKTDNSDALRLENVCGDRLSASNICAKFEPKGRASGVLLLHPQISRGVWQFEAFIEHAQSASSIGIGIVAIADISGDESFQIDGYPQDTRGWYG